MNTFPRLLLAACLLSPASAHAESATAPADTLDIGMTVTGDQDAPLGLFLAPWKEETRVDVVSAPGLHDVPAEGADAQAFARSVRYYAAGRAYRAERLMRNH